MVKNKRVELFIVLLVVVIALVSIPQPEPVLQIYDRGYPVVGVRRASLPKTRIPFQIYDGHLQ